MKKHFGFIEGLSGDAYRLLKEYLVTKDRKHIDEAEAIMSGCDPFIDSSQVNNSLYYGRAGVLLVLMDLYSLSPSQSINYKIRRTLNLILADARISRNGLHWYHSQTQRRAISGWGHGSIGIAYALRVASEFFNSPGLKAASDLACQHTLLSWDKKLRTWPNYRLEIETKEDDDKLLNAFRKDPRGVLKGEIDPGIEDGVSGILLGLKALGKKSQLAIDEGRLSEFHLIGDGFELKNKGKGFQEFYLEKEAIIIQRILNSHFSRTLAALRKNGGKPTPNFRWPRHGKDVNYITTPLEKRVLRSKSAVAADCFKVEKQKLQTIFNHNGDAVSVYCQKYLSFLKNRSLQTLSDKALLSRKFQLNPNSRIITMKHDVGFGFALKLERDGFEVGSYKMLFAFTDQAEVLTETVLVDFEELLYYMKKPTTGKELVRAVVDQYGVDKKKKQVEDEVVELILSKVQENILIESA